MFFQNGERILVYSVYAEGGLCGLAAGLCLLNDSVFLVFFILLFKGFN